MSVPLCERRDGYLGRWLSEPEQVAFEAHLADCPECRQFVQEHLYLDRLLARASEQLQPVPAGLVDRLDRRLRQAGRRRAWAAGLAAAAVLAAGLGVWAWKPRAAIDELPDAPVVKPTPRPDPEHPAVLAKAEVTFSAAAAVIAVPIPTSDPTVTIVWVYPAISPDAGAADSIPNPERSDR
jgi:anti-sigma factor RsiW